MKKAEGKNSLSMKHPKFRIREEVSGPFLCLLRHPVPAGSHQFHGLSAIENLFEKEGATNLIAAAPVSFHLNMASSKEVFRQNLAPRGQKLNPQCKRTFEAKTTIEEDFGDTKVCRRGRCSENGQTLLNNIFSSHFNTSEKVDG